ncbi:GAF domain-containing protein, partial [Staphylococcus aureus]|nr:GAF domain-containing protein [Staphylococcus aureus]
IACDANSKSEIVVPIFKDDKIIVVLDIDATITDRFDDNDKEHLEAIFKIN